MKPISTLLAFGLCASQALAHTRIWVSSFSPLWLSSVPDVYLQSIWVNGVDQGSGVNSYIRSRKSPSNGELLIPDIMSIYSPDQ